MGIIKLVKGLNKAKRKKGKFALYLRLNSLLFLLSDIRAVGFQDPDFRMEFYFTIFSVHETWRKQIMGFSASIVVWANPPLKTFFIYFYISHFSFVSLINTDTNRHFSKEDMQMASSTQKKFLLSVIRKKQLTNKMRSFFTPTRMTV